MQGLTTLEAMRIINPCWSFGPPEEFSWLIGVVKVFSPDYFVDTNPTGMPTPILWYFIPMYIVITLLAFCVCVAVDRRGFLRDVEYIKSTKSRREQK